MSSFKNPEGFLINTHCFQEEAAHFKKYGYYCPDLPGTPGYDSYWDEMTRRRREGYSSGGVHITGEHWGYLNYSTIKLTQGDTREKVSREASVKRKGFKKVLTFPDFWDGDYEYFWVKEIADIGIDLEDYQKLGLDIKISHLEGQKHLFILKARRKGYSYKNGWIVANRYDLDKNSISLIGAQQKSFLFPEGTMGMANNYLNFLNANTAWAKRRLIDKQDHIKSGFLESIDGIPVERGFKSQIMAISFKDNPDAARGKDATLILLEEAGKFSNLEDSFNATKPTVEDGIHTTGQILVFGTGGKDNDDWADFAKMHGNPEAYNALAFQNQWDEGCENQLCGYFVPDFQNKVGFIDKDGNSDKVGAKNYELDRRMKLAAVSTDKSAITQHTIEYPFTPREATALISGNIFGAAIADLKAHKGFLESSRDGSKLGKNVEFIINQQGKVECQVDLGNKLSPCPYPLKQNSDETGCWVIWEEPEPNPPYGLYVSGTDPYNVDKSTESVSLGSTIILKRAMIGYDNHDKIVAEYTGRPQTAQDYYESVRRGLSYYNAICLYENNFNGMKMHFQHQNSLHLLARTPTILKSNANTSIASNYGLRMTDTLKGGIKDELEMYTKDWLMTSVGDGKLNLHSIYSIPILNELITYNSEGNFDRIISLMLAICQKFQLHSVVAKKKEEMIQDPFFHRKFFQ